MRWREAGQPRLDNDLQSMDDRFKRLFGGDPVVWRAPGRVNLIGEHTDYNDGFVMPAAIGLYTWVAAAPRSDRMMVVRSENFDEQVEVDLDHLPAKASKHWSDYVIGIATMLLQAGANVLPASLLLHGDVPQGAGLSSSASLEVALASAVVDVSGEELDGQTLALLCQKAENEFVGARCGIMDQFIAVHGKADHALLLDCRSLAHKLLPLPSDVRLVICNSMVRHSIAAGEYNRRRGECEEGARYFAERYRGVTALRDVSVEQLVSSKNDLGEKIWRRCQHVISENARVQEAAQALNIGDLDNFGRLMHQSHQSLRDDFEVSCPELDLLVELSVGAQGVYGARMTGGGFGGCTVNLVKDDHAEEFQRRIREGYRKLTGITSEVYVCPAADGVSSR
jgi:galactokinase